MRLKVARALDREITGFSPDTGELVFERSFPSDLVERLRPLFDVGADHDMIDVYPVGNDIRAEVERILGIKLDSNTEYFIECSDPGFYRPTARLGRAMRRFTSGFRRS